MHLFVYLKCWGKGSLFLNHKIQSYRQKHRINRIAKHFHIRDKIHIQIKGIKVRFHVMQMMHDMQLDHDPDIASFGIITLIAPFGKIIFDRPIWQNNF